MTGPPVVTTTAVNNNVFSPDVTSNSHLTARSADRRTISTAAGRILPQFTTLARMPATLDRSNRHRSDLELATPDPEGAAQ